MKQLTTTMINAYTDNLAKYRNFFYLLFAYVAIPFAICACVVFTIVYFSNLNPYFHIPVRLVWLAFVLSVAVLIAGGVFAVKRKQYAGYAIIYLTVTLASCCLYLSYPYQPLNGLIQIYLSELPFLLIGAIQFLSLILAFTLVCLNSGSENIIFFGLPFMMIPFQFFNLALVIVSF